MREDLMRSEAFALVERAELLLARARLERKAGDVVAHFEALHDDMHAFRAKWHAVGNALAGAPDPED